MELMDHREANKLCSKDKNFLDVDGLTSIEALERGSYEQRFSAHERLFILVFLS